MGNLEAIELFAKNMLNGERKVMSTDELSALVSGARSEQERDFYVCVYNYLLGQSAKEVIRNGLY